MPIAQLQKGAKQMTKCCGTATVKSHSDNRMNTYENISSAVYAGY